MGAGMATDVFNAAPDDRSKEKMCQRWPPLIKLATRWSDDLQEIS